MQCRKNAKIFKYTFLKGGSRYETDDSAMVMPHCHIMPMAVGAGRGNLANHWKRWDAKPEAEAQLAV